MANKNKKVLISGYIGFGNFGDEAIFSSLVCYLKSKNIKISALSFDPEETSKIHSIKAYNYKSPIDIIRAILSSDVLFSGGGSLLQNNTSNKSLYYYLTIINLAKLLGKKVVIFAQGLDGINGKKQISDVKNALKKCDLITVRDEVSKEFADSLGLDAKLVCDPVYSLCLPPYNPQGYVGIQLRKSNNMDSLFLENLSDEIIKYFEGKKIKIYPFQEEYDKEICVDFRNILKRKQKNTEVEIVKDSSIKNIIKEFSTLEYLIAMRFHACILGSMYGIKTMPIIYDKKVLSVAKKHNMPYINCSVKESITDVFKNIEKINHAEKPIFEWSLFDDIIQ